MLLRIDQKAADLFDDNYTFELKPEWLDEFHNSTVQMAWRAFKNKLLAWSEFCEFVDTYHAIKGE